MLLANMAVARFIAHTYSGAALLRHHAPPNQRLLQRFVEYAERLGFPFDITSSSSLQESFKQIKDEEQRFVMKLLCIKPMQRAKYFCTGTLGVSQFSTDLNDTLKTFERNLTIFSF